MAIKYSDPDWGKLVRQELRSRKMTQKQLGKGMGTSEDAIRMLLGRENLRLSNVRKLSVFFGVDLVEHLLSDESKELLYRARQEGIHPGAAAIEEEVNKGLTRVAAEKEQILANKEVLEMRVQDLESALASVQSHQSDLDKNSSDAMKQLEAAHQEYDALKLELEAALARIEEGKRAVEEMRKEHAEELKAKDEVIARLKEEKREAEYEGRLKASVLEAKLEVYKEKKD